MCGIAGLIHRGKSADVGSQLTSMLQALKHRGPDSTGFALYGNPRDDEYVMRFKVAEQEDMRHGFLIRDQVKERKVEVDRRLEETGIRKTAELEATEYAFCYRFSFDGDMKHTADYVEDIEGVEILSIGNALELIKDLGDATVVSEQYSLSGFEGTHAIGHESVIPSLHLTTKPPIICQLSIVDNGDIVIRIGPVRMGGSDINIRLCRHTGMSNCMSTFKPA